MLLVIDAGNSSISLGLFETPDVGAPDGNTPGGRPALLWNVKIAADPQRSADEYRLTLGLLLRDGGYSPADVDAVALGSVVPALTHTLREALGWLCRRSDGTPVPLRTVSTGTRTGLVLQVDDPAQLGADIVTGAAAAVWLYGTPVAVLDFGTRPYCPAWMPTARCWASPSHRGCKPRSTVCAVRRLSYRTWNSARRRVCWDATLPIRSVPGLCTERRRWRTGLLSAPCVRRTCRLIHRWSPPAGLPD